MRRESNPREAVCRTAARPLGVSPLCVGLLGFEPRHDELATPELNRVPTAYKAVALTIELAAISLSHRSAASGHTVIKQSKRR